MDNRFQIVRRLADGRFHSGEELAREAGISRAAVWKHIGKLQDELGLEIHAVRGRGYRLVEPLELLDRDRILAGLTGQAQPAQLELLGRIDSTNNHVLEQAVAGAPSGYVCLAEQQIAGRGRRGRRWVSPFGSNIYLSMLWRYPVGPARLGGLSLAAGLAVVRGLRTLGVEGMSLKWPNDVLWKGRKLAGLLLEVAGESDGPSRVVLGLGLNTRLAPETAAQIDQPWTDLTQVPGGADLSRNHLVAVLLENLLAALTRFEQEGLAPLLEEWRQYDLLHDRPVTVLVGERRVDGVHRGIGADGALLLEHRGTVRPYYAGEVSLRPASRKTDTGVLS